MPKQKLCGSKKSYKNARDAHCALGLINRTSERETVPTRAYYCDMCNMWHLTSQPKWKNETQH